MFRSLFAGLKAQNNNEQFSTRRRFTRRACDNSVVIINGQIYPVENWSMGGVAINADAREFGVDDVLDVTMKFKLSEDVIDLPHQARVVRKTPHGVGFEFTPLTDNVRKGFQNVVDDYVSSKFAESQYAS